jgi:hypothetical protein
MKGKSFVFRDFKEIVGRSVFWGKDWGHLLITSKEGKGKEVKWRVSKN